MQAGVISYKILNSITFNIRRVVGIVFITEQRIHADEQLRYEQEILMQLYYKLFILEFTIFSNDFIHLVQDFLVLM